MLANRFLAVALVLSPALCAARAVAPNGDDLEAAATITSFSEQIGQLRALSRAASADAATAASSDGECAKNAGWESKVFELELTQGAAGAGTPRKVRLSYDSCGRYADQKASERWFSDPEHQIGVAILSRDGSDLAQVAFYQRGGEHRSMCVGAGFGAHPAAAVYGTGFSATGVTFKDQCAPSQWIADARLTPVETK